MNDELDLFGFTEDYVPQRLWDAYLVICRSVRSPEARERAISWANRYESFAGCPYLPEDVAIEAEKALPLSTEWHQAAWDREPDYQVIDAVGH